MEEYKTYRLGDIAECTLGKMLDQKKNKGKPHVYLGNVAVRWGAFNIDPSQTMRFEDKEIEKFQAVKGDIILCEGGEPGRCAIWEDDEPICIQKALHRIRVDQTIASPYYVYYYLTSFVKSGKAEPYFTGSTIKHLPRERLISLELTLPCLDEQKRRARIIQSLDAKISLNNRINHNLEDFLLSLYGRLLDSQCGSSTIGQVSERVYSGGTPDTKNSDYWGGTINWLSSGETSNHFIIDTEKRITENGVLHSSTKFASKYDVVIASAGQGNTRGQTSMTLLDTCINQSIIVIHANTYEAPIVFCSLANRYDELRAISDASSIRGSLTTKMISALEIPVFPEVETFKFASQAKCIIDQVENNLRENRSLTMMRDSLLPKLMRGGLS